MSKLGAFVLVAVQVTNRVKKQEKCLFLTLIFVSLFVLCILFRTTFHFIKAYLQAVNHVVGQIFG